MKKFMKFLAVVSCCVMVFAMTAFAAKSPSAGDNSATQTEKDMAAGVTANDTTYNGQKVQIIVTPTKEVYIKGAEEAAQKLLAILSSGFHTNIHKTPRLLLPGSPPETADAETPSAKLTGTLLPDPAPVCRRIKLLLPPVSPTRR